MQIVSPCPSHADVKCALTAMADMGLLEADDEVSKLWQTKPLWDMAAKNAAFRLRARRASFTGDDENECHAVDVGMKQKIKQRAMSSRLRHAVKVEPRIDIFPTPR